MKGTHIDLKLIEKVVKTKLRNSSCFCKDLKTFSECEQQRVFHQIDQELDPVLSSEKKVFENHQKSFIIQHSKQQKGNLSVLYLQNGKSFGRSQLLIGAKLAIQNKFIMARNFKT